MPTHSPDISPLRVLRGARILRAIRLAALLIAAAAVGSCSCSRITRLDLPPSGAPVLRVLLADGLESARVSIDGPFEVRVVGENRKPRKVTAGRELRPLTVTCSGGDLVVGDLIRTPCAVDFVPDRVPVELNGRRYRGSLRLSLSNGRLRALNLVDLEGYLRGVVPCEMNSHWLLAALQAQAVAARTYALARAEQRGGEPYDLVATVGDQKYDGFDRETARTDSAVTTTTGTILRYRLRPFVAYYHACCGGATAEAAIVFPGSNVPLHSVTCGYCSDAPRYSWSLTVPSADLARRLGTPPLAGVTPEAVGTDGRVGRVLLRLTNGQTLALSGTALRERLGLLSTHFTMSVNRSDILFAGRGWGHGVGLCQWGAKGMADAGKRYTEILEQYYPGARVNRIY